MLGGLVKNVVFRFTSVYVGASTEAAGTPIRRTAEMMSPVVNARL